MRKFVFITGALLVSLIIIGGVFKALHTTVGGPILFLSLLLFAMVFVPCAAVYYYKKGK